MIVVFVELCGTVPGTVDDTLPTVELTINDDIRALGQVVAGGPIYPMSNIMLSYFRIFSLAKEKLYITNPYFIPNESIMDALKQAAVSGVDVRLMVPEKSDSAIVGAASKFYFNDLLNAGVKIYLYKYRKFRLPIQIMFAIECNNSSLIRLGNVSENKINHFSFSRNGPL